MEKRLLKIFIKFALCALLTVWIVQAIFWDEGKRAWEQNGSKPSWENLTRKQRLEISWQYGPPELWKSLTAIDQKSMAGSVLLVGGTVLLGILRWRLILKMQGFDLPLLRATEISLVAQFFNAFLLGSTGGDLIKAYYAARETHHRKTEAAVTVFADRLIGLFSMLFFAVLMMVPNRKWLFDTQSTKITAYTVILMFLGCLALVFLAFRGGVSRHFPKARQVFRRLPMGEILEKSLDSCRELGKQPRRLFMAFIISMVLNFVCVLQFLVLARGLGINTPDLAMFGIVPMIISIAALPITPSGLGVRENLFVIMLAAPGFNVEPTPALSLSLLALAGSLFWSLLGGVVYITFREKHHLQEIAKPEPVQQDILEP
ncbi:MAG: lysylphosphatidylglycerol synthase transmembrane domain-containing protein [Verrucomicrobiia bacterium]